MVHLLAKVDEINNVERESHLLPENKTVILSEFFWNVDQNVFQGDCQRNVCGSAIVKRLSLLENILSSGNTDF